MPSDRLGGLQSVGAKVERRHHGRTGIKYKTWSYKKMRRRRKKKKSLVKTENFKTQHSAG